VAITLLLVRATAAWGAPETAQEIEQCARDNLPDRNTVQTVLFRSTDRSDSVTESRTKIHWQRSEDGTSKVLMRFLKPLDLRGAGVLLLERKDRLPDTMLYLPAIRKVRRVSSRAAASSVFGTDFSYEDFQRLMGMTVSAHKTREADTDIDGRSVYVIVARPTAESGSSYERVVTYIDKETCVPLTTDSYEPGDKLRKRLSTDPAQITREGDYFIPRSQTIEDLRDATRTEFIVEEIDVDAKIHQKMFSERELEAGAR
jgi:hypothetical protein